MYRKVLVGILLLGALFVFGLATFYVKNWQFYLGKGYTLVANFPAVQTLDRGDVVRMAGVSVGTVQDLQINTETPSAYPVRTVLWLQRGVRVRKDDTAIIKISSVFGGNFVAIERGDPAAAELRDGDTITKTDVSPSVTEIVEQSKATLAEIKKAFEDVSAVTTELREGKGTLGRLLTDEELAKKVETIVADVRESTESLKEASQRLERGEGVLGKLIMDDGMARDLDALVADARTLAENMRTLSEDLRKGEGTLGKLLTDDELYNKLNNSITTISDTVQLFKEGEGILPKLLQDRAMADDLRTLAADARQAAADLKEITAKVRDGESTMGKLLVSDEAYKKLDQLLNSVQGIVDTYREQSPVISLAGAVFGAF